jgi:hypothetical protein
MKNFLLSPVAADGNGATNPPPTIEQLTAENAELREKLANYEAQAEQSRQDEILIQQKMAVGLSRDHAVASIKRQRVFDAAQTSQAPK